MPRAPRTPPRPPGYEPAMGRPDPAYVAPAVPACGYFTHVPGRGSPVCGAFPPPSDPRQYDSENPTCPTCAQWLAAARRVTAARHGRYAEAAAEALAAVPETPTEPPHEEPEP
jgi:hypothetical protein